MNLIKNPKSVCALFILTKDKFSTTHLIGKTECVHNSIRGCFIQTRDWHSIVRDTWMLLSYNILDFHHRKNILYAFIKDLCSLEPFPLILSQNWISLGIDVINREVDGSFFNVQWKNTMFTQSDSPQIWRKSRKIKIWS